MKVRTRTCDIPHDTRPEVTLWPTEPRAQPISCLQSSVLLFRHIAREQKKYTRYKVSKWNVFVLCQGTVAWPRVTVTTNGRTPLCLYVWCPRAMLVSAIKTCYYTYIIAKSVGYLADWWKCLKNINSCLTSFVRF